MRYHRRSSSSIFSVEFPMSTAPAPDPSQVHFSDRLAYGKSLRKHVPRSAHAQWQPATNRPDPVETLESSSQGRVPELIPIRYGRMLQSPFTFLRGASAAMAFDLSSTPSTGFHVQLCGDCHLMNFGGFGTPERNFVFDVTDFDETLPGPWEWDVKRLAASVTTAGRSIGHSETDCKDAVRACVRSYRRWMRKYTELHTLERWYASVDGQALLKLTHRGKPHADSKADARLRPRLVDPLFPKLTEVVEGKLHFRDNPPLVYHPEAGGPVEQTIRKFMAHYRETLQEERRILLNRFRVMDLAMKVVGVGSVGTRCAILLMMSGSNNGLILQYKEAGPSVLEPYAGKSKYHNHGQRVVYGQRLLQAASDLFLGWACDEQGIHFYFRQLRDMKTTVRIDSMSPSELLGYVELCGRALARAHAKAGDPAVISGYLGRSDAFDNALAIFARIYADQSERDHAAMAAAVKAGRLVVK
jgi:uncharacterized protein (DUF2252 family)